MTRVRKFYVEGYGWKHEIKSDFMNVYVELELKDQLHGNN